MRYGLSILLLSGLCAAVAADEPERIALENWRMATLRIGHIVEFEASVKNVSGDPLTHVVVSAEYFGDKGELLGRTPDRAVDNMGRADRTRSQGVIATLTPGRGAVVTVRAPMVAAFARYVVTIQYEAGGEPLAEKFEGGQIGGEAPQRVLSKLLSDRLEVRVVNPDLTALAAGRGKVQRYVLGFQLKNVSTLDATGLKATLEVQNAGKTARSVAVSLKPSVLKSGAEGCYKVDVGPLPFYDSYRVSISFDEPVVPAGTGTREVEVRDLKIESTPGANVIQGKVLNGLDKKVTNVRVTIELSRGGVCVQKILVDDLSHTVFGPGQFQGFSVKPAKLDKYDTTQAAVEYQVLGR